MLISGAGQFVPKTTRTLPTRTQYQVVPREDRSGLNWVQLPVLCCILLSLILVSV